jgi:predicted RNase H-like HicB family nuclease
MGGEGLRAMKKFNISTVLYPQEGGGYTVISPELRGCVTDGNTVDEALKNFREAASLLLEGRKEENPLEGLDRSGRIYAEVEIEA